MRLKEKTFTYRLSAFLLFFFGMFVRRGYDANLYALLTIPTTLKIDNIEALYWAQKSDDIKLIAPQWFRIYKEQMIKAPCEKMREIGRNTLVKGSDEELFEKVKTSTNENNYVLIGLRDVFELLLVEYPDDFYLPSNVAQSSFIIDRFGVAVQKGNQKLLKSIDKSIRQMQFHGLFEYWYPHVFLKLSIRSRLKKGRQVKKSTIAEDSSDQLRININMHSSTFYSFVLGIMLATFSVGCEVIYWHLKKEKARKKTKSYRRSFQTRFLERQKSVFKQNYYLW